MFCYLGAPLPRQDFPISDSNDVKLNWPRVLLLFSMEDANFRMETFLLSEDKGPTVRLVR